MLLIPSLPVARVKPLFRTLLEAAEPLFEAGPNLFVEIDALGRIASFRLP